MRLRLLLAALLSQAFILPHSASAAQRILLASSQKGEAAQPISLLAPATPRNGGTAPAAPRIPSATARNSEPAPAAIAPVVDKSSVVVSVAEQRLYVFDADGRKVAAYRVSTSKYGLGDDRWSYATPTGQFEVATKIGRGAAPGTVFRHCRPTGEICPANAAGRDPIVTRILALRGLEKHNAQALSRGIFIHGTADERHIGRPASYGCIRMKSRDVLELFEQVHSGTRVEITPDRVGNLFGSATRPVPGRG
jgi:lipoprotein-anchoring transpeptidase ErfK/SrfK